MRERMWEASSKIPVWAAKPGALKSGSSWALVMSVRSCCSRRAPPHTYAHRRSHQMHQLPFSSSFPPVEPPMIVVV